MKNIITACLISLCWWGCSSTKQETASQLSVSKEEYGTLSDGRKALLYTLQNSKGTSMQVTNYGGIITSLSVIDKNGEFEDIVLGFDHFESYLNNSPFFGALIGRYGNRIGDAKFSLDDTEYTLSANDGKNHLHGGLKGFDQKVWYSESFETEDGIGVLLKRMSLDGEEGYPGDLQCEVTYTLTNANQLILEYKATTNKKTVVNLTNHSYFNLSGNPTTTVLDHQLELPASKFVPVNETLIPTGELTSVAGTPFDFQKLTAIGQGINDEHPQIRYGGGYDHCWVYTDTTKALKYGGMVYEATSGRVLKIHTTEPGVQFYSGNFLDGTLTGKGNIKYNQRSGLCLETQHFPDSPNQSQFPTTVLEPGQEYYTKTVYEFSIKE
ncbi:galactose mutarotase [Reichenbachiella sp. 5M10]|nr:galactose mutarotase [Reichenbachiella sp. 5M10]